MSSYYSSNRIGVIKTLDGGRRSTAYGCEVDDNRQGFHTSQKRVQNHNYLSLVNLSIKLISSEYLPSMVIYGISHVNL